MKMIYFIIDGVHILREKVIIAVAVILGLVIAFFVYQNFYPEDFMEKDETTITMSDIEKNKSVHIQGIQQEKIFRGFPARKSLRISLLWMMNGIRSMTQSLL